MPGFSFVSSEILEKAERSETDIIVIGTQDIFAAETIGYGGGALRVAKEAGCNVFLARETDFANVSEPNENMPTRTVFILNEDDDAEIVKTAARRKWAEGSKARIITIGAERSPIKEARAAEMLQAAGLNVSIMKPESDSPSGLVEAVLGWNADCIFAGGEGNTGEDNNTCGRRNFRREVKELLRRTKCSVELVRKARGKPKTLSAMA